MVQCNLINHTQYNLNEREQNLRLSNKELAFPHILLSTCNRIEQYWGEGIVPENVLRHLYRVASGLESSLLGERAIQGQVKQAYTTATERFQLSPSLHKLFQTALHTGKRVRSETHIAEGAVSHSQVTVEILKQKQKNLQNKDVGIIGVNKLTEDILKYLSSCGAKNILLANRCIEKAQRAAKICNGTVVTLAHKQELLQRIDVLICATSAPHCIIKKEDVPTKNNLLIFDLAFPRDVDELVGRMEQVELLNLEDIERYARQNIKLRKGEIKKAERIINEEMVKFQQWQNFQRYEQNKINSRL
jgi:glutamyl-tRNA reductase